VANVSRASSDLDLPFEPHCRGRIFEPQYARACACTARPGRSVGSSSFTHCASLQWNLRRANIHRLHRLPLWPRMARRLGAWDRPNEWPRRTAAPLALACVCTCRREHSSSDAASAFKYLCRPPSAEMPPDWRGFAMPQAIGCRRGSGPVRPPDRQHRCCDAVIPSRSTRSFVPCRRTQATGASAGAAEVPADEAHGSLLMQHEYPRVS
jgi:hypothetical protein